MTRASLLLPSDCDITVGALCCIYRSVHRDAPSVLVGIGTGAHACDRHIPNIMTQSCRHIRDEVAGIASSLATIPDSFAKFIVEVHKYEFEDTNSLYKVKRYFVTNVELSQSGPECISTDDLDVYLPQFPPQCGIWLHRWMLKATSYWIKSTANKSELGSAHDHRDIMTSPGYTGISRRDMQTSAPSGSNSKSNPSSKWPACYNKHL